MEVVLAVSWVLRITCIVVFVAAIFMSPWFLYGLILGILDKEK